MLEGPATRTSNSNIILIFTQKSSLESTFCVRSHYNRFVISRVFSLIRSFVNFDPGFKHDFLKLLRALVFFVTNDVVNFINIIRARFSYESHCPNETIIAIIFAIIISKNTRDIGTYQMRFF